MEGQNINQNIEANNNIVQERHEDDVPDRVAEVIEREDQINHVAEAHTQFERLMGISLANKEKHLLTATKEFNNIRHTFTIKYGVFGLQLKQPVMLQSGTYIRHITNEATSNFSCTNLKKELAIVRPGRNNFVGCNRQLLCEDGTLNMTAVISDLTRNFPDKFFIPKDVSEHTSHFDLEDSHVFYIYNMLTTWLYTLIYECNPERETVDKKGNLHMKIKIRRPKYEDSHCEINYGMYKYDDYITVEHCQAYMPQDTSGVYPTLIKRRTHNYFMYNHVVRIPSNISRENFSFYAAHLLNRKPSNNYINFDVGFKTDIGIIMIDQAGTYCGTVETTIGENKVPCTSIYDSQCIIGWIIEYVNLNHLYHDFALATELLFRAAFWPVPETQEGNVWVQQGNIRLTFPEFKPIRGIFPNLFFGDPYVPPGIVRFYYKDKYELLNQILYGALENYAMIYALQVQIYVRTHFCHAWYEACRVYNETRQITNAWNLYEVLFKIVYKVSFITNMSPHGYLTFIFNYKNFEGVTRVLQKTQELDQEYKERSVERAAITYKQAIKYGAPKTTKFEVDKVIIKKRDFQNFVRYKVYPEEVTKYVSDVEGLKRISVYDNDAVDSYYDNYVNNVIKTLDTTKFAITTLPAWVTGAMLDATIDLPTAYSQNLKPEWKFQGVNNAEWSEINLSKKEALKLTQAVRYFNKDIQFIDDTVRDRIDEVIKPWANVHQRIIEPSSILYKTKSSTVCYYGEITQACRKPTRFDRDIWSLIEIGYSINKAKGSFYLCEFLSTRLVSKTNIKPINYDPEELQLLAEFQPAHTTNLYRIGFEEKGIEEKQAEPHFHRPGTVKQDPTSLLPGIVISREVGLEENQTAQT